MVRYDESVIRQMAEKLQAQAAPLVFLGGVLGLLLGGLAGLFTGFAVSLSPGTLALAGAVAGLLVRVSTAQQRAMLLRFQAQVALCQAQVERNTRR